MTNTAMIAAAVALTTAMLQGQATASETDTWQTRTLYAPSQDQLAAERKGRVTVFEGLLANQVDQALDEQFDRIQHMMFVRTKHATEDGGLVEDDDC